MRIPTKQKIVSDALIYPKFQASSMMEVSVSKRILIIIRIILWRENGLMGNPMVYALLKMKFREELRHLFMEKYKGLCGLKLRRMVREFLVNIFTVTVLNSVDWHDIILVKRVNRIHQAIIMKLLDLDG